MTTNTIRFLLASALCGLAFAAGAQTVTVSADAEAGDMPAQDAGERISDRNCLRHTGSRITEQANARADARKDKSRRECAPLSGRSYTREDIDRTGAIDIADALRRLDPSVH